MDAFRADRPQEGATFGGGPRSEDVETSEAEKWHYIGQHAQDYPGFDIVRFYEKNARGTLSELVDRPGGAVLVACYAGFNRSCAVVALHLLDRQELSLHDAIATILKGQPYALWGNDDFVKQIVRYAFRCRYAQDRIAQLSKKNGAADAALLLKCKLSPRKTSGPALGNASEMFATGGADPPAKCLKLSR